MFAHKNLLRTLKKSGIPINYQNWPCFIAGLEISHPFKKHKKYLPPLIHALIFINHRKSVDYFEYFTTDDPKYISNIK